MTNTSLIINSKTIKVIAGIVLVLAVIIIALNYADQRIKHNAFIVMHHELEQSPVLKDLELLVTDSLDTGNDETLSKICDLLKIIERDIENVRFCRIFIKKNDKFYEIYRNAHYINTNVYKDINEYDYLPWSEVDKLFTQLVIENRVVSADSIYEITKGVYRADRGTAIRINNALLVTESPYEYY